MQQRTCILMFSGGRDSTLAAVRLAREWDKLVLVTVTSGGLNGIARVTRRISELRSILPQTTSWVHANLVGESHDDDTRTCLTCHQAYIVAGAVMADRFGATDIALGYSGYQSGWAEQTPYAIKKLGEVLTSNGFSLVLPVVDVQNKVDAIKELEANKLSTEALEQKCVRQIIDPGLTGETLYREVDVWSHKLKEAMSERAKGNMEIVTVYEFNDAIIDNVYPRSV